MDFLEFKNKLSIVNKLPGWPAQKELSPPYRKAFSAEEIYAKSPREASVLILLYKKDNQIFFPVILRTVYEGIHSGQIGLPGGKKEIFDISAKETALRETQEELGLKKHEMEIVKKLTPLYIPPSNFYVQPYIAFYKERNLEFNADKVEVEEIIEIDLKRFLFGTEIVQKVELVMKNNEAVPAFQYDNILIWGATAMILNEFKFLLKNNIFTGF